VATHRVLVVEDDHGIREVLARRLREEGFHAVTAVDGASALRTAEPVGRPYRPPRGTEG
jgi:two-component system response regulator MprA